MNLIKSEQFDDVDAAEKAIEVVNIIADYEEEDEEDIDDITDYLEYHKFFDGHESSKTALNISNFEAKVDLSSSNNRHKSRTADKSDNATSDRSLDKRSMKIMYKMMQQGHFCTVNGCISGGKEANVYHAPTSNGDDLVLKVYMTSTMTFKTRERYVNGDVRFSRTNTNSSTKLATVWAEKEFRNLRRLWATEGLIACPQPIQQKSMVVLMSMIGSNGVHAPRLKDVSAPPEQWEDMYMQTVVASRRMYRLCRLVHADLSEYNLLWHDNRVFVIDVSQSVEREHPEAFHFLRKDCTAINTFFRRKAVRTLSLREFFFFVIGEEEDDEAVFRARLLENEGNHDDDDAFFMNVRIERTLGELGGERALREYRSAVRDPSSVDHMLAARVTGIDGVLRGLRAEKIGAVKAHKRALRTVREGLERAEVPMGSENRSGEYGKEGVVATDGGEEEWKDGECANEEERPLEGGGDGRQHKVAAPPRTADETPEQRNARKKAVKEQQRLKRVQNKEELLDHKFKTVPGFKFKNKAFK